MNIVNLIYHNSFLNELFPNGLEPNVLIGQVDLDRCGRLRLDLHTRQKPSKEIKKWGIWGEDYDVIVIHLHGTALGETHLENWEKADYGRISLSHDRIANEQEPDVFTLLYSGESWYVKIQSQGLSFDRCSVHSDGRFL